MRARALLLVVLVACSPSRKGWWGHEDAATGAVTWYAEKDACRYADCYSDTFRCQTFDGNGKDEIDECFIGKGGCGGTECDGLVGDPACFEYWDKNANKNGDDHFGKCFRTVEQCMVSMKIWSKNIATDGCFLSSRLAKLTMR